MNFNKFYTLIIALFIVNISFSQGLINNGANIVITSGANIYIDGDANGGYTNQGAGQINSDGTIYLEGNWTNNGSTDVYTAIDNTGATVFSGTTLQEIGGSHNTTFENLTMNNTGSGAFISRDEQIQYTLTMTDGDFDLRNNDIQLVDATSTISGESSGNRLKSTDGSGIDGQGTGTIYTIRNNPSGNIANLGLTLPSITGNNITIARGHLVQSGTGTYSGNSSVFRYFQISPVTNAAEGSNITFEECYTPELNGHNSSNLIMYQWISQASSGTPAFWSPLADNSAGNGQAVSITRTLRGSTLDYIKVTLGSSDNPLPVELTSFKAECEQNGVNISWTTASEKNNDYFVLEKSTDMTNFASIANINGQGTINQTTEYNYFDYDKKNISYYRLSQFDFNGNKQVFKTISSSCNNNLNNSNISAYYNYNNQNIEINLGNSKADKFNVYLIDNIGRQITVKQIIKESNKIYLNNLNLAKGVYNIIINSDTEYYTKKILINY